MNRLIFNFNINDASNCFRENYCWLLQVIKKGRDWTQVGIVSRNGKSHIMVCIYLNLINARSFYCHQVTKLKWNFYLVRSEIWPARSEHHNCLNFWTAKALLLGCVRLVTQLGRDAMNYYHAHGRMVKPLKKVKIHPGSLVTCQQSENIKRFRVNQLCHLSIFLARGKWFVRPNVASEPRTAANACTTGAPCISLGIG